MPPVSCQVFCAHANRAPRGTTLKVKVLNIAPSFNTTFKIGVCCAVDNTPFLTPFQNHSQSELHPLCFLCALQGKWRQVMQFSLFFMSLNSITSYFVVIIAF